MKVTFLILSLLVCIGIGSLAQKVQAQMIPDNQNAVNLTETADPNEPCE